MKIVPRTKTPYQQKLDENQVAEAEKLKAEKEYNEMMGTWIDPSVHEEEEPDGQ